MFDLLLNGLQITPTHDCQIQLLICTHISLYPSYVVENRTDLRVLGSLGTGM